MLVPSSEGHPADLPSGRHLGRHRAPRSRPALPKALGPGAVLPTAAAAALVLTAAGAGLGQTPGAGIRALGATVSASHAPTLVLELSVQQRHDARAQEAAELALRSDLTARRQDGSRQASAALGRVEAHQRAVRAAKRKAAALEEARARKIAAQKKVRAKAAADRREAALEGKRWVRAIRTGAITSGFARRWGKHHDGLDIGAPTGTPLHAMSRGTVVLAANVYSFGNKVEIRYWNGTVSWYGHLSRIDVRAGQTVMPGDVVGAVGNTGHSFGSHLHLEIHPSGGDKPVDPYPWLERRGLIG